MDAPLHEELKAAIQSKDVDAAIAALFASKLRLCNAFRRAAGAANTAFTNAYHRRNSHANSAAIAVPTSSLELSFQILRRGGCPSVCLI